MRGSVVVHSPFVHDVEQGAALRRDRDEVRFHAFGEKDSVHERFRVLRPVNEEDIFPSERIAVAEARAKLFEGQLGPRRDDWSTAGTASAHGLMVGVPGLPQCSGMSPEARAIPCGRLLAQ